MNLQRGVVISTAAQGLGGRAYIDSPRGGVYHSVLYLKEHEAILPTLQPRS